MYASAQSSAVAEAQISELHIFILFFNIFSNKML